MSAPVTVTVSPMEDREWLLLRVPEIANRGMGGFKPATLKPELHGYLVKADLLTSFAAYARHQGWDLDTAPRVGEGTRIVPDAQRRGMPQCANCGLPAPEETSERFLDDGRFCPGCGEPWQATWPRQVDPPMRTRLVRCGVCSYETPGHQAYCVGCGSPLLPEGEHDTPAVFHAKQTLARVLSEVRAHRDDPEPIGALLAGPEDTTPNCLGCGLPLSPALYAADGVPWHPGCNEDGEQAPTYGATHGPHKSLAGVDDVALPPTPQVNHPPAEALGGTTGQSSDPVAPPYHPGPASPADRSLAIPTDQGGNDQSSPEWQDYLDALEAQDIAATHIADTYRTNEDPPW